MTDSDKALMAIYQSAQSNLNGMAFEQFRTIFNDWEIVPLKHDLDIIGGVLIMGNELHVGYSSAPKASIRSHIKATLNRLIDSYGYAMTTIREGNQRGADFCKRLGFVQTKTENGTIHMRCDRCNYA